MSAEHIAQRVRAARTAAGLTQEELAGRADVSRALVGAVERGRHMPAADAAIRLAAALGSSVERLFGSADPAPAARAVVGDRPADGALVRAGRLDGAVFVRAFDPPSAISGVGASADGVVAGGTVRLFAGAVARGAVVAGCDPVLSIAEGLLEHAPGDERIVGVPATTGQSLEALAAGRCHAVLVHGPRRSLKPEPGVRRWHLARWRSGFATHPRLARPSLEALLAGEVPLVQRDRSAACQQAVERAARRAGAPRVARTRVAGGHLAAAQEALALGGAAVAIEPVAMATGLEFSELETHDVELWVPERWSGHPGVRSLVDLLTTRRFLERAGALPAYDLTDTGAAR